MSLAISNKNRTNFLRIRRVLARRKGDIKKRSMGAVSTRENNREHKQGSIISSAIKSKNAEKRRGQV